MATVKGPFCSGWASGSIGKMVSIRNFRRKTVALEHGDPNTPETDAVRASRGVFTMQARIIALIYAQDTIRKGWQTAAGKYARTLTGYNLLTQQVANAMYMASPTSWVTAVHATSGPALTFTMIDSTTLEQGGETGLFDLWGGPDLRNLTLIDQIEIIGGTLEFALLTERIDNWFFEIRKSASRRSGLMGGPFGGE